MGLKARPHVAPARRAPIGAPTLDLAKAYQRGARFSDNYATYTIELVQAGSVRVISGKLWAGDPFTIIAAAPFRAHIPNGTYPVVLSVAHIAYRPDKGYDQERVACAMVQVRDQPVARWRNASCAGQRLDALKSDEFYGYGVDAGTGSFMDARAVRVLERKNRGEYDAGNWEGWLLPRVSQGLLPPGQAWGMAELVVDRDTGANVVCFSSGWGDGVYGSFWGYTNDEQIACVVTDFAVLPRDRAAVE